VGPRELRPLAVGEIVDAALRLCRENLRAFVLIALAIVLPAEIAMNAIRIGSGLHGLEVVRIGGRLHLVGMSWSGLAVALGAIVLVAVLQALFALAACSHAALLAYVDCEPPAPRASLAATLRRSHSVLWLAARALLAAVLLIVLGSVGLAVTLFVLLPVVLAVFALAALQVALMVAVLFAEGQRGRKALKRVRALSRKRSFASIAVVLVAAIPVVIVEVVSGVILFGVGKATGRNDLVGAAAGTVLGTAVGVLLFPLAAATTVVLYVDLRIRKEGFDVELAAERLGLESRRRLLRPAPPPAPLVFGGGTTPPYWPPPPGWTPQAQPVPLRAPEVNPNLPPFWPPPAWWKPPQPPDAT
jgi:hypothetical protein